MDQQKIRETVENCIAQSDLFIVDISLSPSRKITILLDKYQGITIDECITINRQVVQALSPEIEDYDLEISSPGLTEPFRVPQQYQKYLGQKVEVVFLSGEKLKGVLQQADDTSITLEYQKKVKEEGEKRAKIVTCNEVFQKASLKSTKLVLTFK